MVVKGNFLAGLKDPGGLVLATTNGVVKQDGSLVIGAGAAKALAERFPELPRILGKRVNPGKPYGLIVVELRGSRVGAFQTKYHWQDPANLALIAYSTRMLRAYLMAHPDLRAHLPFPGVGLGGLREDQVLPILERELRSVGERVFLYRL
ncbi:MAG: hypothetical protein RMK63_13615 [Thermus sp.]|nr:hypothetical protein [Thermus sp.]